MRDLSSTWPSRTFSLTHFEEAKSHAEMIVEVTQRRLMPPWIPGPATAHRFIGQRWLSDGELKLIVQWVEDGCAFGNEADLPPTAKYADVGNWAHRIW